MRNALHGFDPTHGIKYYDLVCFDADDLSADGEAAAEARARELMADAHVKVDVTNEARVLWYRQRFGRSIPPYRATEHAISTWRATASSIGVRVDGDSLVVCAPFGLRDLFAMVVRPNKAITDEHVYNEKANRWADHWPRLRVLPWQPNPCTYSCLSAPEERHQGAARGAQNESQNAASQAPWWHTGRIECIRSESTPLQSASDALALHRRGYLWAAYLPEARSTVIDIRAGLRPSAGVQGHPVAAEGPRVNGTRDRCG